MNNFETYKLDNGVEVLLVPMPESLATTVMATVKVGSKYEHKDISGLSHFLEHMAFKGTTKRPQPSDIAIELDGLGAQYNAFTGQESTAYYAKARNQSVGKLVEIVSDLYLHPTFPEAELEKERGVIIEEINMYEDMPMYKVADLFLKVLYGDQPAGWSVAGRKEVIQGIKRDEFITFRTKHYTSENTIVALAGGYDPNTIRDEIFRAFGSVPRAAETALPPVVEHQEIPQILLEEKDSDQTHLVVGFRAFDVHDERKYALMVLSDVLGGGMSSRLFRKLRDEMGVAYYVHTDADLTANSGVVSARAGVSTGRVEETTRAILSEFKRLTEELIPDDELRKAKESIIGNLFLSLETSDNLAGFYTSQRVDGLNLHTPEHISASLERVTADDVQRVARDLFVNRALNFAAIGPFKERDFGDIVRI